MKSSFEKIFLSLLLLFVTHCSGADVTSTGTATIENDFDINEGEAPDYEADTDESDTTTGGESTGGDTEEASEDCAYQDVEASPKDIVFSLGQLNPPDSTGADDISRYECQTVSISGCYPFKAELVSDTGSNIVIANSDGDISSGIGALVEGEESFQVCCTHNTGMINEKGQVNVYVGESSVDYAFVIEAECDTLDSELITLNTPTDGQYVWEHDGISSIVTESGLEFFQIPVEGTINIGTTPELKDILVRDDDGNVNVKFTIADQVEKWSFNPDSEEYDSTNAAFSINGLIPSGLPGVYNVSISLKTTLGTFTKSVDVIRLTEPDMTVSLQDYNGNILSSTTETPDTTSYYKVVSGIEIGNTKLIGEDTKLSLYVIKPDGTVSNLFLNKPYYDGFEYGSSVGEDGKCPNSFANSNSTYCTEYLPLTVFGSGLNTIVAKACNTYTHEMHPVDEDPTDGINSTGCVLAKTYVVTDTSLPQITCTTPVEGQIFYKEDNGNIKLNCTLENFAETVTETDITTNVTTDKCNVKLFVNSINLDGTEENIGDYTELCDDLVIVANEDGSTTNANTGNIRKATFEYTLPRSKMLKYNNFVQIVIKDKMGNQNYFTRSFIVTKDFNKFTKSYINDQLTTKAMGKITSSGETEGSPIMIKISEETLTNDSIVKVIRKILNDNFDFTEMGVQGGALIDKNNDEEVDLDDFIVFLDEYNKLDNDEDRLDFIEQLLHKPNPYQLLAKKLYRVLKNDGSAYFNYAEGSEDEIAALDACDQPLTLTTLPLNTINYTQPRMSIQYMLDNNLLREWPIHICQKLFNDGTISDLKDCNTMEQGVWDISLNLKSVSNDPKDGGFIDVVLTLNGKDGGPALYGNSVVYSLIEGGTTHNYNMPDAIQNITEFFGTNAGITDPVVPLFFNIGKLTITLKDMLQVVKAQKKSDKTIEMEIDPDTGEKTPVSCYDPIVKGCSTYLYINGDKLKATESSIQFEKYDNCQKYFESKFPGVELPWGCSNDDEQNWPLAIDVDSDQGYLLWSTVGFEGTDDALPSLMIPALQNVFRNTFACIGTQMVGPILDSEATPYQDWVPEEDRIDEFAFAVGTDTVVGNEATTFEINDNLSFGMEDDIEDPLFRFKLNLKESDLIVQDGSITFKLLIDYLGANVDLGASSTTTRPSGPYTGSIPASITPQALGEFVKILTRSDGFPYESPDQGNFENVYPKLANDYASYDAALGISLGLEPLGNAALSLMINQGFEKLLKAFDVGNIELVDAHTLRINRVSLSKMGRDNYNEVGGICGIPPASTDFSNNLLIGDFGFLFKTTSMNLDIRLKNPPTLAIEDYDDDDDSTTDDGDYHELQIGMPDVEIDFRDISPVTNHLSGETEYKVGDIVFTARLDLVLRLLVKTEKVSGRERISIYLLPLKQQIMFTDVIKQGASAGLGLDEGGFVKVLHEQLLQYFWKKLASTPGNDPTFAITLPPKITDYAYSTTIKSKDLDLETDEQVYDDLVVNYHGIIIEDNTALDPTDECDAGEVYNYARDWGNTIENSPDVELPDIDFPRGGSSGGGRPDPNPNSIPDHLGDESDTGGGGIIAGSPSNGPNRHHIDIPQDVTDTFDLDNPCNWVKGRFDLSINEALCELGIDEIKPEIEFTFIKDGGFINISLSASVQIYQWLTNEVNGETDIDYSEMDGEKQKEQQEWRDEKFGDDEEEE